MGKRGPCCHCGITNTPLWRNGPPGKPVLCNACGSRWRTKGTLANYVPLHALKFPPEDKRNSQYPKFSSKRKLESVLEMSPSEGSLEVEETLPEYDQDAADFEDDSGNRSSSGSGISASESCVQLGSMDGNDISGSAQSHFWDSHVPSRKRTGIEYQSASSIEKLRRDLYGILQEQESSCLSGSSEEVLLFERQDPTVSIETGLGSVLIRRPLSSGEESEESSHMKENKISYLNDTCMRSAFVHALSQSCEGSSSPVDKDRMIQNIEGMEEMKEQPAKQCALADRSSENTLLGNLNIELNVAAQKGSMKNQSHISTNLHLPWGSLNTARASVARQPKGHMRHVWSNSNIKLSILPPGSRQKLHCARIHEGESI